MSTRSLFTLLACTSLIAMQASAFAEDKAASAAKKYTREEIEAIVIDTIMKNPQVIIDSVDQMQAKKESEAADQARQVITAYKTSLFEKPGDPYAGNPKGDVTIVEFFDYNCGYCKRSLPNVLKLLGEDKNVKVIFKDFPVLSPSSEDAAKAALTMNKLKPEKYLDYHAALFNLGGKFDEETLATVAEGMGVAKEEFKTTLHSTEIADLISEHRELATKLGAQGVPVFIIGNDLHPGAITYEVMKAGVAKLRADKKK